MADIPTSRCQEIGESTSTFDLSQPSCKDSDNLSSRRSNAGPGIQDLEGIEPFSSEPLYSIFSTRQKQYIIFLTAWGGFFSGLSSSIYYPALNAIAKDLNVSNAVINLTLTSFMIFQGLAPTIFGGTSVIRSVLPLFCEISGDRMVFLATQSVFEFSITDTEIANRPW